MGQSSSTIPELDEALLDIENCCKRNKTAFGKGETLVAGELRTMLRTMFRNPTHKLRGRDFNEEARTFTHQKLVYRVRKALEYRQARVFSALFKFLIPLCEQVEEMDSVTLFIELALNASDKCDLDGNVTRAIDRAFIARCLRLVFTRFHGDANDPSNQTHGGARTPLIDAIRENRPELVRVLLDNGANANCDSYDNGFPILWAVKANSMEMVRMLAPHSRDAITRLTRGEFTTSALRHGLYGTALTPDERERACVMLAGVCGLVMG